METTALGAAFLAGLTVGYWKDLEELKSLHGAAQIFEPKMDESRKEELYKGGRKQSKLLKYLRSLMTKGIHQMNSL